jgi:hypothetical protein
MQAKATWILTKLGGVTGMPIICSSNHPEYSPEKYDIAIGQGCFERNWSKGRLVNIADFINLAGGNYVFAFKDTLHEEGIEIPEEVINPE